MAVAPVIVQRRMMQLGRVRMGEKGAKGEPKRLTTFRFTSASQALLQAVAERYGGKVQRWAGAPDEGYYEVTTSANELHGILPPTFSDQDGSPSVPYSQWFELYKGPECVRRCDGVTEAMSGQPCLCNPDERNCSITTRLNFMLPDIPGLGVWRLDSHGWNAAAELPGTLELLRQAAEQRKFIPFVLRIEPRTKKVGGQTRRFVVPVIDLPGVSVNQLAGGDLLSLNAPQVEPPKPELPAAPEPPEDPAFEQAEAEFGQPPPLPGEPEPQAQEAASPQDAPAPGEGEAGGTTSPSSPTDPIVVQAGEVLIPRGNRAGKTVAQVAESEPEWCLWYLENGLTPELKAAITTWLYATRPDLMKEAQ